MNFDQVLCQRVNHLGQPVSLICTNLACSELSACCALCLRDYHSGHSTDCQTIDESKLALKRIQDRQKPFIDTYRTVRKGILDQLNKIDQLIEQGQQNNQFGYTQWNQFKQIIQSSNILLQLEEQMMQFRQIINGFDEQIIKKNINVQPLKQQPYFEFSLKGGKTNNYDYYSTRCLFDQIAIQTKLIPTFAEIAEQRVVLRLKILKAGQFLIISCREVDSNGRQVFITSDGRTTSHYNKNQTDKKCFSFTDNDVIVIEANRISSTVIFKKEKTGEKFEFDQVPLYRMEIGVNCQDGAVLIMNN